MKATHCSVLAAAVMLSGFAIGQSAGKQAASDRDKLIGAWHLVSMEEPGADASQNHAAERKGSLIYTRDGHMSVQIMYPPSEAAVSNDYVLNGYEASFGSYDLNEATHTLTHHVQASLTRGLIGKDLPRTYQISGKRLVIHSANPAEHWSVTWEHD